jgi:ABC-type Fe3+-siderophore transport system permease subunit
VRSGSLYRLCGGHGRDHRLCRAGSAAWSALLLGNDQRLLLPACVLAGGAMLSLADLLARTVVAPIQLPVGVITALVGVPLFLWLLARSRL